MAEETPFTVPEENLGEGPSEPDPKEPPVRPSTLHPTIENHTPDDHIPENTSENASGDPVMQFVVQNFEQINAMYSAFSSKRKEASHTPMPNNDDHPVIEPWHLDLEGLTKGVAQEMPEDAMLPEKPIKRGKVATDDPDGILKQKHTSNAAFYANHLCSKRRNGAYTIWWLRHLQHELETMTCQMG